MNREPHFSLSGEPAPQHAWPAGHRIGQLELQAAGLAGDAAIVYRGWDHALSRAVAIKEYLPPALVKRRTDGSLVAIDAQAARRFERGRHAFIDESRTLARCDHPSLVRVSSLVEAHGTAFCVMPWYAGRPLPEVPLQRGGPLEEPVLRTLIDDLLGALEAYHRVGGLYGGLNPSKVLLLEEGRALLLGPGAAAHAVRAAAGEDTALPDLPEAGFAPPEQTRPSVALPQGPWTDFYALAAVARFCITGLLPAAAGLGVPEPLAATVERLFFDMPAVRYSPQLLRALEAAMSADIGRRPQTVAQFRQFLLQTPDAAWAVPATPMFAPPASAATPAFDAGEVTVPVLPTENQPAAAPAPASKPTTSAPLPVPAASAAPTPAATSTRTPTLPLTIGRMPSANPPSAPLPIPRHERREPTLGAEPDPVAPVDDLKIDDDEPVDPATAELIRQVINAIPDGVGLAGPHRRRAGASAAADADPGFGPLSRLAAGFGDASSAPKGAEAAEFDVGDIGGAGDVAPASKVQRAGKGWSAMLGRLRSRLAKARAAGRPGAGQRRAPSAPSTSDVVWWVGVAAALAAMIAAVVWLWPAPDLVATDLPALAPTAAAGTDASPDRPAAVAGLSSNLADTPPSQAAAPPQPGADEIPGAPGVPIDSLPVADAALAAAAARPRRVPPRTPAAAVQKATAPAVASSRRAVDDDKRRRDSGPRQACANRASSALARCLQQQCSQQRWARHPQCKPTRGAQQAR